MALRSGSLPNFINGISQQAVSLRLPSQAQEQINCFPTVIDGLKKRPPLRHRAHLMTAPGGPVFTHAINRDVTERYEVIISSGSIRVFTLDGVEKTVHTPDGTDYLINTTADVGFNAVTVADYTFIVNKSIATAMAGSTSPSSPFEALINVIEGAYGKTYAIALNGSSAATYTTPNGSVPADVNALDTNDIAANLVTSLAAHNIDAGHGWTVTQYDNVIYLSHGTDFTINTIDGFANQNMIGIKSKAQHFSNLPLKGPTGIIEEVVGDDSVQFDNYYVTLLDGGIWHETVAPAIPWEIDASTMPHVLVRESDGTFTFKEAAWNKREVGDETTNPDPSFIGKTINDLFFHRNRLGLLADENVIMSAAGDFFRFWRKTVTAVLDDDPIDISATHTKVSILRHAVPFRDQLVAFSDQTQFSVHTPVSGILTPKAVAMTPTTELPTSRYSKPVATGDIVFFLADGGFTRVYQYQLDPDTQALTGDDITNHVPAYIPGGPAKSAVSSKHNTLAIVSAASPSRIYCYDWLIANRERLQAAWHYWDVGTEAIIKGLDIIDSDIIAVVQRDSDLWLEAVNIDPKLYDNGLTYWLCLDRRVHSDDLAAPTYNSVTGFTTYVLPYTATDTITAVLAKDFTQADIELYGTPTVPPFFDLEVFAGTLMTITSRSGTSILLEGDTTTRKVYFGFPYRSLYTLSSILPKRPSQGGGAVFMSGARLQLRYLSLVFGDNTAEWVAEVTPDGGRETKSYRIGRYPTGTLMTNKPPLGPGGVQRIPIMTRSDTCTISFVSDSHLPGSLVSAEWEGQLFVRASPAA